MPRPRKVQPGTVPTVDVPAPPSQAANAAKFPEGYDETKVTRSTGVPIEQVKLDRPFGPGADYPSATISVRYHEPDTGRTFQFTWSDATIQAIEGFCDMLDERGYVPCNAPDAPRASRKADPLDEDKAIGRKARKPVQRRMDDDDDNDPDDDTPVLNFGKYSGQTVYQVYHSGKDGRSYVQWLSETARRRDIRKAAQQLVD